VPDQRNLLARDPGIDLLPVADRFIQGTAHDELVLTDGAVGRLGIVVDRIHMVVSEHRIEVLEDVEVIGTDLALEVVRRFRDPRAADDVLVLAILNVAPVFRGLLDVDFRKFDNAISRVEVARPEPVPGGELDCLA